MSKAVQHDGRVTPPHTREPEGMESPVSTFSICKKRTVLYALALVVIAAVVVALAASGQLGQLSLAGKIGCYGVPAAITILAIFFPLYYGLKRKELATSCTVSLKNSEQHQTVAQAAADARSAQRREISDQMQRKAFHTQEGDESEEEDLPPSLTNSGVLADKLIHD